ncbi:hypothetical protein [Paraburkholderia bannensis]|uniref:hypothetical protein n=1 Tax=Paraburkholderia bannensis TaxID=765414 RepID=UPI002AB0BC93|nr:hypothetical protein [Paraburkholderia bannensis]
MKSYFDQSAEIVELIERTGMRQELEDRVEARKLDKRKQLVAERGLLLKERDEALPAVEAAAREAREQVALLDKKLAAAKRLMQHTEQRAYGTWLSCGTAQIDDAIERNAPKFMQDALDALQEPIGLLQGAVQFWPQRRRVGWGFQNIDVSNVEEIAALRRKCQEGQIEIRAMMYDVDTPIAAQRARCMAIVEECIALTHPNLKDDRHWLTHQERKARAAKMA